MPPSPKPYGRWHAAVSALVSVAAALFILLLFNKGVEWLAGRGHVQTYRGVDDVLQFVDEPLFALDKDGWYQTTPYAEISMVHSRFRGRKGDAWRAFILGESFAMGTPYALQGPGRNRPGGIPSFLSADLEAMAPKRPVEVINAAAGAQNSHRVLRIAEQALLLSPDLIVVAACNNEGVLTPGIVTETLHRFAGARIIGRLLTAPIASRKRSYYTPQDPDTAAVRKEFRANIHAILGLAAKKNVRVLLATLPVNLRYQGDESGHAIYSNGPEPDRPSPCLGKALSHLQRGRADKAQSELAVCEDVEALRVLGGLKYDRGSYDEARRLLKQYTELVPRNRCRPSFNEILREEAAAFPNARLADLEKEAEALSLHGIPGPELFVDYCHMNWIGYAAMEKAMLRVLEQEEWLPGKGGRRPSLEELRRRFDLDERP